jgi:uncharacterized Zn finger protein (UPF0148 family)
MLAAMKAPGGDASPKASMGGLGGFSALGNMGKKMAANVGRTIDEQAWKKNVMDANRVRNVARKLWLDLEHNSEAVIRVAMEIVTCRKSRKILWWNDEGWMQEEGKPEMLKNIIEEKLNTVIQQLGKDIKERPIKDEGPQGKNPRELKLEQQLEETQKKLKLAELSLAEAQRRMAELEDKLDEYGSRPKGKREMIQQDTTEEVPTGPGTELPQMLALVTDIQEGKQARGNVLLELIQQGRQGVKALLAKQADELEKVRKQAEDEKAALQAKFDDLDRRMRSDGAAAAVMQELDAERSKSKNLQAELARLRKQLEAAQVALRKAQEGCLQADLLDELERLRAASKLGPGVCPVCAARGDEPVQQVHVVQEVTAGMSDAERKKFQEEIKRKDKEIESLKADQMRMQQEKMDMLGMIAKLKKQIERLQELADKAGYGDLVRKMLQEADLTETLQSKAMSIFTRLYQDALRRMIAKKEQMKGLIMDHPTVNFNTNTLRVRPAISEVAFDAGEHPGSPSSHGTMSPAMQMSPRPSPVSQQSVTFSGGFFGNAYDRQSQLPGLKGTVRPATTSSSAAQAAETGGFHLPPTGGHLGPEGLPQRRLRTGTPSMQTAASQSTLALGRGALGNNRRPSNCSQSGLVVSRSEPGLLPNLATAEMAAAGRTGSVPFQDNNGLLIIGDRGSLWNSKDALKGLDRSIVGAGGTRQKVGMVPRVASPARLGRGGARRQDQDAFLTIGS